MESIGDTVFITDEIDVWFEYEARKRALPPMDPDRYEEEVRKICQDLGI